jgi:hypothetical protein
VSGAGDVVGAWEDGPRRLVLRDDGTLFWVNSWDAEAMGTFEVDGATFSIVNTSLVEPDTDTQGAVDRNCPTTGRYEVELVAGANLRFSAIEDDCVQRTEYLASAGDREWTPARPSGPIETTGDLAGVYERQGGQYAQFNEDGTFGCASSRLNLGKDAECKGEVSFEGATLSVTAEQCPSGSTGVYRVERLDTGFVQFEATEEDACAWRSDFLVGPGDFSIAFEPTR